MSSDHEQWPAPIDSAVFESLCLDLWMEIWGPESGAQKNGRSGQPQAGVDVFGRDREGRWIGVQCKQKSALLRSELSVDELEDEVEKSDRFSPPLSVFIVATTGPRDGKVQARARELTRDDRRVEVWSWPDIWHELDRRPELLERIGQSYWPMLFSLRGEQTIAPTRLPRAAEVLFGRESELAALDAAWVAPAIHLLTLVAWGGVGKTSLVARWSAQLAERGYDGASVFDWSFYSQGTREQGAATGEPFVAAALRFFGGDEGERLAASPASGWEKGAKLAGFVARRRALLVLDGLEPLQFPPSSPLAGQLKDPGVKALLRGLAQKNPGLCVVTTRESVADLAAFHGTTAPEQSLERLSPEAGVALLERLGVKGLRADLAALVEEVRGHALTLQLVGGYLARAHSGDARKRHLIKFDKADAKTQGGHAWKALAAYERWFLGEGGTDGARQLALLRLLGLFDRPADAGCLGALRREPVIPGLTDALVGLDDEDWTFAASALAGCGLLTLAERPEASAHGTLDAHPLVREYFGKQLRDHHPDAWRAAHGRLFEHLRDSTENQPDTLEGLQPLYQAVVHGCQAGRQQEACDEVYTDRILRGTGNDGFYSTNQLGAIGADLGAVACFFESSWRRVSPALTEAVQAWLLNEAGVRLRALGRLTEALEPMRAGLEMRIAQEDWKQAAIGASNLSELELTVGDVAGAVRDAEQSVTVADRSRDGFWRLASRTAHADALHQAGRRAEARVLFDEAERFQTEDQPESPRLYSLRGFQFCDLLLAEAGQVTGSAGWAGDDNVTLLEAIREVEERGRYALAIGQRHRWLLDSALDLLTLGRAALYRAILAGTDPAAAKPEIEAAVDGLRRAGTTHHIPRGLLTRAWLRHLLGDADGARADLAEVEEIAAQGPMPLFLADAALLRARLFGDRAALARARELIDRHGYGRRREELADLEAALG